MNSLCKCGSIRPELQAAMKETMQEATKSGKKEKLELVRGQLGLPNSEASIPTSTEKHSSQAAQREG